MELLITDLKSNEECVTSRVLISTWEGRSFGVQNDVAHVLTTVIHRNWLSGFDRVRFERKSDYLTLDGNKIFDSICWKKKKKIPSQFRKLCGQFFSCWGLFRFYGQPRTNFNEGVYSWMHRVHK
jgi:hypothetical protein